MGLVPTGVWPKEVTKALSSSTSGLSFVFSVDVLEIGEGCRFDELLSPASSIQMLISCKTLVDGPTHDGFVGCVPVPTNTYFNIQTNNCDL